MFCHIGHPQTLLSVLTSWQPLLVVISVFREESSSTCQEDLSHQNQPHLGISSLAWQWQPVGGIQCLYIHRPGPAGAEAQRLSLSSRFSSASRGSQRNRALYAGQILDLKNSVCHREPFVFCQSCHGSVLLDQNLNVHKFQLSASVLQLVVRSD